MKAAQIHLGGREQTLVACQRHIHIYDRKDAPQVIAKINGKYHQNIQLGKIMLLQASQVNFVCLMLLQLIVLAYIL